MCADGRNKLSALDRFVFLNGFHLLKEQLLSYKMQKCILRSLESSNVENEVLK